MVGFRTTRIPRGKVAVGSNGNTTGGKVFGGRVGKVLKASEFAMVKAVFGLVPSRNVARMILTPVRDRDSIRSIPGA